MNEIDAFENFKFNVGDLVAHVSGSYQAEKGIVIERALVQSEYGFFRWYSVAFGSHTNAITTEMELKPYSLART